MWIFDSARFAIRNLSGRKQRLILSVLGISIGMMSVVLTSSIGQNAKTAILNEIDKLAMNACFIKISDISGGEKTKFSLADISASKDISDRENALLSPLATNYSYVSIKNMVSDAMIVGSDENLNKFFGIDVKYGRLLNKNDVKSKSRVAFIDNFTAKKFYKRENIVGKEITLYTANGPEKFTVIGIGAADTFVPESMFSDVVPSLICIPYTTMNEVFMTNTVSQLGIKSQENEKSAETGEKIAAMLNRKNNTENAFYLSDNSLQKNKFNFVIDMITSLINAIAAVSLLVGGFGIMTIMLSSVIERTNEIGIKKAVGATNLDIMMEFLTESVALTFSGGILGILAGAVGAFAVVSFLGFPFSLNLPFIFLGLLFIILTGIIFGVYPAITASRLDPIEALRRE